MSLPKKITDQLKLQTKSKLLHDRQKELDTLYKKSISAYNAKSNGGPITKEIKQQVRSDIEKSIVPDREVQETRTKLNLMENKLKNIIIR